MLHGFEPRVTTFVQPPSVLCLFLSELDAPKIILRPHCCAALCRVNRPLFGVLPLAAAVWVVPSFCFFAVLPYVARLLGGTRPGAHFLGPEVFTSSASFHNIKRNLGNFESCQYDVLTVPHCHQ